MIEIKIYNISEIPKSSLKVEFINTSQIHNELILIYYPNLFVKSTKNRKGKFTFSKQYL